MIPEHEKLLAVLSNRFVTAVESIANAMIVQAECAQEMVSLTRRNVEGQEAMRQTSQALETALKEQLDGD